MRVDYASYRWYLLSPGIKSSCDEKKNLLTHWEYHFKSLKGQCIFKLINLMNQCGAAALHKYSGCWLKTAMPWFSPFTIQGGKLLLFFEGWALKGPAPTPFHCLPPVGIANEVWSCHSRHFCLLDITGVMGLLVLVEVVYLSSHLIPSYHMNARKYIYSALLTWSPLEPRSISKAWLDHCGSQGGQRMSMLYSVWDTPKPAQSTRSQFQVRIEPWVGLCTSHWQFTE